MTLIFMLSKLSKPPVFDDLPSDNFELPQAVEALKPELMVMLGSRSLEACSNSDKNNVESFKAPHHSTTHIEN